MNRRIGQVALVAGDRRRSTAFYEEVFGLSRVFGTAEFRGPAVDRVQAMEKVASSVDWLVDDRAMFQLEIFEFENPGSRPLPRDHGLHDEGYNRIIVAVKDLNVTCNAAVGCGGTLVALLCEQDASGPVKALLRDPDGILIELVEAPEMVSAALPARIVGIGLTSARLDRTIEDFCDGFGFQQCEDPFRTSVSWDRSGPPDASQALRLEDMYLIVSCYTDMRPRRSDRRLADIGVMNVAVCFPDQDDFAACYRKTRAMGMRPNAEPMVIEGRASVAYHNDRQGVSVEMIYLAPSLHGLYGFARPGPGDRLLNRYLNWKSRRAYRRHLAS